MRPLKICCLVLGMMSAFGLPVETNNWPVVQRLYEKHTFTDAGKDDADTPLLVFIKDATGAPAYKLECHNGFYEEDSEINFSGDFQCALFAMKGDKRTSWNLLAVDNKEEHSSDWNNRGRMLSTQLRGPCAEYPDYNNVRHFKLRGMLITFQFTDMEWGAIDNHKDPQLTNFTFEVSAVPDKNAHTSAAEEPQTVKPPGPCGF